MEQVEELAYIVSSEKPSSLRFLVPKASKLRRLFNLAGKGEMCSNEEAARWVYQAPPGDKKFVMLKKNLVAKLTELVLLGDYKSHASHSYMELLFHGRKKLIIAEKLLLRNVYHNAEKLLKKVLNKSQAYSLVELEWEASLLLRRTYAMQGRLSLAEKLDAHLREIEEKYSQINRIKGNAELHASRIKYGVSSPVEYREQIRRQSTEALALAEKYQNPFFSRYGLELALIESWYGNDFDRCIWALGQIGELMQDHPYVADDHLLIETELYWIRWNAFTRRYQEAAIHLQKALDITAYQAFNRFDIKHMEWVMAMHQGQWRIAMEVLKEIRRVPQRAMLHETDRAAWELREGFWFLCASHWDPEQLTYEKDLQTRSLEKWEELLAPLSNDKQGYNILLLLFRLGWLRLHGEQEAYQKESYNLKVYRQRNLKSLINPRINFLLDQIIGTSTRKQQAEGEHAGLTTEALAPDLLEWLPLDRWMKLYFSSGERE